MKVKVNLEKGTLDVIYEDIGTETFSVTCNVRTVKSGTRGKDEVVLSIPDRLPYDPRPFPKGNWLITKVEWHNVDQYGKENFSRAVYGPVKIRTNAFQMVNVWELDPDGDYFKETDKQIKDEGYLFHYSDSKTTLGCIRKDSDENAIKLGKMVEEELKKNGFIPLEVI